MTYCCVNDSLIRFLVYVSFLKTGYTGISIVITNDDSLNLSCFGESVNKSEWFNITGKLTQRDLFNYNYGMVGKAIKLNKEYNNLKKNIKDDSDKKGIESLEFILFGNTLKPNMAILLKLQKDLAPIYNNKHALLRH